MAIQEREREMKGFSDRTSRGELRLEGFTGEKRGEVMGVERDSFHSESIRGEEEYNERGLRWIRRKEGGYYTEFNKEKRLLYLKEGAIATAIAVVGTVAFIGLPVALYLAATVGIMGVALSITQALIIGVIGEIISAAASYLGFLYAKHGLSRSWNGNDENE